MRAQEQETQKRNLETAIVLTLSAISSCEDPIEAETHRQSITKFKQRLEALEEEYECILGKCANDK